MADIPPGNYPPVNPSCPPGPPPVQNQQYQSPPPYYNECPPPGHQPPAGGYYPGTGPHPPAYGNPPPPPQAVPGYGMSMPPENVPSHQYQQKPQMPNQKQKKKGMFSGILDDVTHGLDSAARDIGGFAGRALVGDSMKMLKTGNVVQFYYTKTGRTMQIIRHPMNGALVVDVGGYLSPQAYNAHWFIHQESGSIIKLYNQDNFLGAHNGSVILMKAQNPVTAPGQTRWKVHQSASSEKVISLESMSLPGHYLTVGPDDASLTLNRSNALSSNTYLTIQFVTNTVIR